MAGKLFDLTGKVAVVTGAARGLGRAMSLALAEHGADLVLVDLNGEGAQDTAEQIKSLGRRALPMVVNMTDTAQVSALFSKVDTEFGRIDFLGNVAGDALRGRPESIPLEDVRRTIENLVITRFFACQEAGKRMLAQKSGSIVSIGSIASVTALGRGHIAYSMGMGGVVQMTRELSTEWSGRGVRVNAILPAQVVNPDLEQRMTADPAMRTKFLSGIPAGRMGTPDDIRGLSVFLASDASRWITGAIIPMDGGNLAMNAGGSLSW
jgi:NAD(P)-dependent dehydrogenase (short-subunit alcohol dehydrogenase family)